VHRATRMASRVTKSLRTWLVHGGTNWECADQRQASDGETVRCEHSSSPSPKAGKRTTTEQTPRQPQGGRSGSVPQDARSRVCCGLKEGAAAPEASLEGQRKRNVPRPAAVSMLEPSKLLLANQRRANRAAAIATLSAGERVTLLRRIA